MVRQLKTFVTSSGFFELAVAAPTMKAALEIWGAGADLFRRGYAKETNDAAIVKATMAKPGTVLQRPVGGNGVFKEHADLPDVSSWEAPLKKQQPAKAEKPDPARRPEPAKPRVAKSPPKSTAAERAAERKAERQFEAAQKKREREAARADAADRKARERREQAIQKAETAIAEAQRAHDERVVAIEKARDAIETRAREEDDRWEGQISELKAALRKAQG